MKPSVLIVDDDEVMQESLYDVLKKGEYEVYSVGSGSETLSVIKKNIIDLILLDMRLPDWDGLELLKKIKE
ncbi:MAG: response regulator, partial [Deltaproteobacteria bacterium]|nr:response regulator [Deltaproteobacteria bacterium]